MALRFRSQGGYIRSTHHVDPVNALPQGTWQCTVSAPIKIEEHSQTTRGQCNQAAVHTKIFFDFDEHVFNGGKFLYRSSA